MNVTETENIEEGLREHLARTWPSNDKEEFVWTLGPIRQRLPAFRVMRIAPQSGVREPWVYVSLGAWEAERENAGGLEFFILSPVETPRHVETLAMVANFHADPNYHLSLGQTINIGRPWLEGSTCDHLLLSLPYPYGPSLEWSCVGNNRHIRFLWLLPITRAEADFVKTRGPETFERLFEQSDPDPSDPHRKSII
ncbi:MAG TPA: suppressor of fused domain protein [Pyrinomonadaceae bacterium]|jgi:hypothetical protein|nr:suppressor of fused domain protein [Pyrinomonadaceae bacterium]